MSELMRALVVDDEAAVRRLTIAALRDFQFACDQAADGEHALEMIGSRRYDVVVTDLRMPRRHGHSLAVELLGRGQNRPLVVVLTGVAEPRLAADLIARGVDDVVFKPLNFQLFAAKVRALCLRRREQHHLVVPDKSPDHSAGDSGEIGLARITTMQIEQRLDAMVGALPVSHAAIEVANLVEEESPSIPEIARAIARDPSLTIEVLRLANSAKYLPAGQRIDDLQEAISRVGYRQIGHLALAATTMHELTKTALAWIDPDLVWQRSLATSLAIEHLHPTAELGADDEGLFLSSLFVPMSRVLTGLAFPDLYQRMVARCRETSCSLASLERRFLPMSPPRAMAGMLARWNLSPRLIKPLQQSGQQYQELTTLTEPLRSKVEQLRVAELLGHLAVGQFQSWDEIDFPSPETMCRLRASDFELIVEKVRTELAQLRCEKPGNGAALNRATTPHGSDGDELRYFKLSESYDLLSVLLQSQNMALTRVGRDAACQGQAMLVNCLDVSDERMAWFLDDAVPDTGRTLVCSTPLPPHCESWGHVVQLPTSFQILSDALKATTTS